MKDNEETGVKQPSWSTAATVEILTCLASPGLGSEEALSAVLERQRSPPRSSTNLDGRQGRSLEASGPQCMCSHASRANEIGALEEAPGIHTKAKDSGGQVF